MALIASHLGSWTGDNAFRLTPDDPTAMAAMSTSLSVAAGGILTTVDYSWSHPSDGPQSGLLVVGPGEDEDSAVALWADSWHQSPAPRVLLGTLTPGGVSVGYEYAGDWRWQITIDATDPGFLELRMDNVVPESAATEGVAPGPYPAMVARLQRDH